MSRIKFKEKIQLSKLSQEEYDALKHELAWRQNTLREEIKGEFKEALELGDTPENFPFDAAVTKLRLNESRIKDLEFLLRRSVIKKNSKISKIIKINDSVEIENENGEKRIVRLVTKDHFEISTTSGLVTLDSPIGKALIGRKVDEIVEINLPKKVVKYKIISIE